jgi:threonine synthase
VGNPASGRLAEAARDASGGMIEAVTDDEILSAQAYLAAREGIFVEPASAAGVAGLIALADRGELASGQQIVVTVTGHGLKDIDTALVGRGPVRSEVVSADLLAIASVCGLLD